MFKRLGFVPEVIALLLLLAISAGRPANAQQDAPSGTDLVLHKFQPKVAPELAAQAASAIDRAVDSNGISHFASTQMLALQQEKDARTPAQQKIDSNLLYTERMLLGQPAAPGVQYLYTGVDLDANNNLVVDMVVNVTDSLLSQLSAVGAQVLYSNASMRSIRAVISPEKIEGIAASPDVIFISPKQEYLVNGHASILKSSTVGARHLAPGFEARAAKVRKMIGEMQAVHPNVAGSAFYGQGTVETEGDLAHQAFEARGTYGVTGAGLKIGVLSDSVTNAATSQATGDLPPTCGSGVSSPCLTVLSGQAGTSGDEGTAMLEIIHDMVPSADLYFATADPTITAFATNIRALQAAGCNIIVDDVGYFVETPFQDGQIPTIVSNTNGGVVTQAVNDVVAAGVFYFSSAANSGGVTHGTSGTYEGDFSALTATSPLPTGSVHNFGSVGSPIAYDTITLAATPINLIWADPLGGSSNDYDLYLLSTSNTIVASSTNVQSGTQDPYEQMNTGTLNYRVVVFQKTGAATRAFHLNISRGTFSVATTGETHGHGAASGAYTVAATPAATSYGSLVTNGPSPGAFTSSNVTESFSSDGPRRYFFKADSTPVTSGNFLFATNGGSVLNKPDITASDGVSVTGVGGFGSPFYGTSAAAPSAASVAALVLSAKPTITAVQMKTALTSTAIDIMSAGVDRDSGAGIVMPLPAIASLSVAGSANPEFGTITATENPGNANGILEAGEGGLLTIQLKNTTGVQAATGITATLTSSTTGVTILQPATSAYADLAIGAGAENNLSPFAFTLASTLTCGQLVKFALNLSYNGSQTRVLNFTVQTGMATISNTLGSTPTLPTGITFATGTQTGRVTRTGSASACGTTKSYPGTTAGNHTYDAYSFQACTAMCLTPQLSAGSAGVNLFEVLYSPSFSPSSISANYKGDPAASNSTQTFGVSITSSTNYSIVVADVGGNPPSSNIPNAYSLQIPICALSCSPYPLPIALVHAVTVTAGAPGGTAAASIDNGSNDPNSGPVTITQNPAGPYSIGTTSVILTITNKYGAFAQGTANVTVNAPAQTTPVITWNPSTHTGYVQTAIGSGVLNASTATTGGTFAYTATNSSNSTVAITSASGLPIGAYTLTATFTPTDTTNYTTATATQSFTVVNQEVFVVLSGGSTASFYDGGTAQSGATSGGGIGAAVDAGGNVWSINTGGSSVSKFTDAGAFSASYSPSGVSAAKAMAIDGNNMTWIANGNGTVSAITNTGTAVFTTPLDPAGGSAAPASISVDSAGSLWLSTPTSNTIAEVIGVAGPVATPTVTQVINSSPGTKP